jgi:amino acid transporter
MNEPVSLPGDAPRPLPRVLGFWGVTAVMIGIVIGSGIFQKPSTIAQEIGDPWTILGLWVLGGVLSLCGAFTYAELATMFPQSGGVYVFLREGYGRAGRCIAFVFGWTYMLISKPFAAAGIAYILGINAIPLLGLAVMKPGPDGQFIPDADANALRAKILTSVVLIALTLVNILGVKLGARVAGFLTIIKVGALIAIALLAFLVGERNPQAFVASAPAVEKAWYLAAVVAMSGIMWTYDGWSDVGAMAGEVKDARRRLPICYIAGTLAVTAIYVGVNAAYFWIMSMDEMRSAPGGSVAPVVAGRLLGEHAGTIVALIIVVSTLGSTHGSIMTGARVSFAQSRDGLLFAFLGRTHPRFETPAVALLIQVALSLTALWTLAGFNEMADGFVFTMWIFYGLAGLSIFTLRWTRPGAERPYRCLGYPVVPAVFVLAALAMTVLSIMDDVKNPATTYATLKWLAVLAAGVPVYFLWERLRGPKAPAA